MNREENMVSNIEFLEAICERMQQVGLIESKAAFSSRILGKGSSYLTSMSTRGRHVPEDVLAILEQHLECDLADSEEKLAELREELHRCELRQKHRADLLDHVTGHGRRATSGVAEQCKNTNRNRRSIKEHLLRVFRFGPPATAN